MKLISAGCSFLWGSELSDEKHCGPGGHSMKTYPALLAKDFNLDYICASYPGSANNCISRMAIDACQSVNDKKGLIVMWTFPQRIELRISDLWKNINSWHTVEPEFSELYFKYINSEYYEIYSILKEVVFLQQYLNSHNIPYMFLTADNNFYKHENYDRRKDRSMENLFNEIEWEKWFFFPPSQFDFETTAPRGFYQWAVESKYPQGPEFHPLDAAHADAALLMKEKFFELVAKFI